VVLNIGLGDIDKARAIAKRAGQEILKVYNTAFAVATKADDSPVTAADHAAERLILDAIRREIADTFPIVSEEAFAAGAIPDVAGQPFWLVDPLDGTREFVKRNGEFTVNIALIETAKPALGVVHVPVLGATFWGSRHGSFAEDSGRARQIHCRNAPAKGLTAMISRHHAMPEEDAYLAKYPIANKITAGSSLKFCRIAEGKGDIYPRFGRTMEWDTAAGHAVLLYAGGSVTDLEGRELRYGKPGFDNPSFVAKGANLPDSKG
jgi:3'(2'), 5'-bisphosphate nucleotidase